MQILCHMVGSVPDENLDVMSELNFPWCSLRQSKGDSIQSLEIAPKSLRSDLSWMRGQAGSSWLSHMSVEI